MSGKRVGVLFVCTGNICRSPTAEGVFKRLVVGAGLAEAIFSDSAGTHAHHVGEPPDPRTLQAAARRGYDLGALRGRQVALRDFAQFDYVLAMDEANLRHLEYLCPALQSHKLRLFLDFAPAIGVREVPDPYYGGAQGFERVLDMAEQAARGLLQHVRERLPN